MISIVVATVTGREESLRLFEKSLAETIGKSYAEMVVETDHPSWGAALRAGMKKAEGDIVMCTADDLHFMRPDWEPAVRQVCESGGTPIVSIYTPDGVLETRRAWISIAPVLTAEQWGLVGEIPSLNYADVWIAERCHELKIPFMPCPEYEIQHNHTTHPREYSHEHKQAELEAAEPGRVRRWAQRGASKRW